MKRLVILSSIALMVLVVGCQQTGVPPVVEGKPSLAIMVESNSVEAGSSFMVSGSNFKPYQKAFIELKFRASDYNMVVQVSCEADDNGLLYSKAISIPGDVVPGDYEVEIFTGKSIDDRELIATLPVRIQAR